MIAFLAVAAAMLAVAVAWVLVPLLARRRPPGPDAAAANLAVLRDQLAEIDADLARGTLSPERYEQAKLELERRALDEAKPGAPAPAAAPSPAGAWTAAILGAVIPVAAIALYLAVGTPRALLADAPGASASQHEVTPQQLEAMIAKLAAHVEKNPDDAQGWRLLARSYYIMSRYPEAVRAYERATTLAPRDADLLTDYADALAVTQGRSLQGKPLELVQRALAIDPDHWKALALAGTAAFASKDYGGAIAYWERLKRVVPGDAEIGRAVDGSIAEARELAGAQAGGAGRPGTAAAAGAKVAGRVSLAPALAASASTTDTVFVFARAVSGPPMPLAVLRKQVKDLPFEFTLDDSMAMAPNRKLSDFAEIVVGARVSRSGNALPQSGDLQGFSRPVKVGATGVAVVIGATVR